MTREELKNEVMRYIDNNLYSEFVGDRTDIILRILYELEEYFDYKSKTIDKVIDLIINDIKKGKVKGITFDRIENVK